MRQSAAARPSNRYGTASPWFLLVLGALLVITNLACATTTITPALLAQEAAANPGRPVQRDEVTMVMHRVNATEPIEREWHRARATVAGFVVLLPGPFNDFTMTALATDGVLVSTHIVGTQTAAGIKYAAIAASRADGKKLDRSALEDLAQSLHGSGKSSRPFDLGAHPGIEVTLDEGRVRAYLVGPVMYQLVVEFPPGRDMDSARHIDKFFSSFQPQ